jgi:hypothetical protein
MPRTGPRSSIPRLAGAVAVVAAGVAVNTAFDSPLRTIPALLLIAVGVAAVTDDIREYATPRLRRVTKRWWVVAFLTFLPHALATAPESESAAAVGNALAGPVVGTALEALAGATVLCAVAMTVVYGFARYGIRPGGPTPEERILNE